MRGKHDTDGSSQTGLLGGFNSNKSNVGRPTALIMQVRGKRLARAASFSQLVNTWNHYI